MVEWYPHVLVISTLYPRGPDRTLNVVEFYYPEEIALFEREFHLLAQLAHPRGIEVYDYGIDAGRPYYTRELLDGGDVR